MGLRFLAVLAAALKAAAVGAPFEPGLRIFSPEPAAMRFRFAAMFAYKPRFLGMGLGSADLILLGFLFAALKGTEIPFTAVFCGVFAAGFGLFLFILSVVSGH